MIERFYGMTDVSKACLMASIFLDEVTPESINLDGNFKFDYSNITVNQFILLKEEMLHLCNPNVVFYKTLLPWSKAQAKAYPNDPNTIYLNTRRLNRSIASLAGSIVHEFVHCLESITIKIRPDLYFNHGKNDSTGKDDSAPYLIGQRAELWVEEYMRRWDNIQQIERTDRVAAAAEELGSLGMRQ